MSSSWSEVMGRSDVDVGSSVWNKRRCFLRCHGCVLSDRLRLNANRGGATHKDGVNTVWQDGPVGRRVGWAEVVIYKRHTCLWNIITQCTLRSTGLSPVRHVTTATKNNRCTSCLPGGLQSLQVYWKRCIWIRGRIPKTSLLLFSRCRSVFVLVFFRSDWNPIGFTSLRHLKQKKKEAHNDLVGWRQR